MRALWAIPVVLLASSGTASAADRDFDHVVHSIEAQYGVKKMHIPLMGVANLVVKVAHPAGATGFKLAVFPDMSSVPGYGDPEDLDRMIGRMETSGLQPIVRTHSRQGRESTYIFCGPVGKSTRLLIASFQPDEATLVEVTVTMDRLLETLRTPQNASKTFILSHGNDHGDSQ